MASDYVTGSGCAPPPQFGVFTKPLDWSQALDLVRRGKKVRQRAGSPGWYVWLDRTRTGNVAAWYQDGKIRHAFAVTEDTFASDWYVVVDPPRQYTTLEAMPILLSGTILKSNVHPHRCIKRSGDKWFAAEPYSMGELRETSTLRFAEIEGTWSEIHGSWEFTE